jgi:UDP-2,4-diacetamido-2,4,6-trideoxy-beta-L-altropyranose hydrolase
MANFNSYCIKNIDKSQKKFRKKILFRADSSSFIGLGHIMRDLVLAKQFEDDEIFFACRNLEGNIIDKIPYPTFILKSDSIDELIELILDKKIDMLVIDHYGICYEDEKKIKEKTAVKIFVLDDTYEKHYCDILLNHNISANKSRYEGLVPKGCELRCGREFTLIRDEFYKQKQKKREKIYDLFISLGGNDSQNLIKKVLDQVNDKKKVIVVTSSSNPNLISLKKYINSRKNITLKVDSNKIAKLLNQSKFAIITPSVMVHEVLFMGVDFITIKVASNQDDIHNYLKENGYKTSTNINDLKRFL